MLRKLEFDTIYYAYLNESPFKYYISILGGGEGSEAMLVLLIEGEGVKKLAKPAYIILALALNLR